MRPLFQVLSALALALAVAVSGAAAVPRYETVTLTLLKSMDQPGIVKLEREMREMHGFGGVTWDLAASRCRVTLDSTALCKEDLVKAINQKSADGTPVVALYQVPPVQESLAEIGAVLTSMDEVFAQTQNTRDLLPLLDRLGPHVQALGEAVRAKEPPAAQGSGFGPLYEKSRDISIKVYVLQSVVKRDYPQTTKKALDDLRVAVEEMEQLLNPPAKPAER